jgi:hypothetical protein
MVAFTIKIEYHYVWFKANNTIKFVKVRKLPNLWKEVWSDKTMHNLSNALQL